MCVKMRDRVRVREGEYVRVRVRMSIRKDCRHFLGAETQTRCEFLSLSVSPHDLSNLHVVRRAEQDADITDLFQVLNITDAAQINALFHSGA